MDSGGEAVDDGYALRGAGLLTCWGGWGQGEVVVMVSRRQSSGQWRILTGILGGPKLCVIYINTFVIVNKCLFC